MRASRFVVAALLALSSAAVQAEEPVVADAALDGGKAFRAKCGFCHLERGTGTIMLGWRLGADRALLEKRTDLDAAYVRTIVRTGLKSMPALTRIEVTDAELAAIASYLASPKAAPAG